MKKIAIASGKGGTGKTFLAVNLSSYLSKEKSVLLVDLDVEEPNSALFIKANMSSTSEANKMIPEWEKAQCILCGICAENCNFHSVIRLGPNIVVFEQLCHSCYACSELCPTNALPMKKKRIGEIRLMKDVGLTFVDGTLDVGEEQAVPLIRRTQQFALENSNDAAIEIIDCPPGNSCSLVAAVKDSDFVILITEPTPFGLNDLKIAVETMQNLNKSFGVVINRDGIGDAAVETYCFESEITILGKIRFDRRIAEIYARGELVFDKIGHVNQSVMEIVAQLEKELHYV